MVYKKTKNYFHAEILLKKSLELINKNNIENFNLISIVYNNLIDIKK